MSSTSRIFIVASVFALCGCEGARARVDDSAPRVSGLGNAAITVGEPLYVLGQNFYEPSEGETVLDFSGEYRWTDAQGQVQSTPVQGFQVAPKFDGDFPSGGLFRGAPVAPGVQVLRWNRFGPFSVPFMGEVSRPGTFVGAVRATNLDHGGQPVSTGPDVPVTLEVKPSILIRRLDPVVQVNEDRTVKTAGCEKPALRVFGNTPYVLEVEAMGFVPRAFQYVVSGGVGNRVVTFNHPATGTKDVVGDPSWPAWKPREAIVFDAIDEDADFSLGTVRVRATSEDGQVYETGLPLSVVRPIQFFYDGNRSLAEYYEPVVVHGPIVGGIGTTVVYSETHAEARQTGVAVSMSQTFAESYGKGSARNWSQAMGTARTASSSTTEGWTQSETETSALSFGTNYTHAEGSSHQLSTTEGTSWGINHTDGRSQESFGQQVNGTYGEGTVGVSTTASGGVSIPGLASLGGEVETSAEGTLGQKQDITQGQREGQTQSDGWQMGGSQGTGTTFGSVTSDSRSVSMQGTYGLARQNALSQSRTQSEASTESTTYQMGSSESVSENYSKGNSEAWASTWATTSTDQTLLSYSSRVPNGRCAVVYRQTVRYVRTAKLFHHDICGVRSLMGEMSFNEWSWSPNIAIGDDCTRSLPPSTQPKAQCFLACE